MIRTPWFDNKQVSAREAELAKENELLKKQIRDLLTLEETGFFVELDSLLRATLNKTLMLCKAEASFLALTGDKPYDLDVRISNSVPEEKLQEIKDAFKDMYDEWQEHESNIISIKEFTLLPLMRRHKLLGMIGLKLNSSAPDNLMDILPILASRAASSLESAILYEKMFKRLLVLSNVFVLGKEIVSNIDINSLLEKFSSISCDGTESQVACVYRFQNTDIASQYARCSIGGETVIVSNVRLYTPILEEVRNKGKMILENDLENSKYKDTEPDKIPGVKLKDTLIIPLSQQDKSLGAIQVANKQSPGGYTVDDIDLLQILANQLASVLQNADLFYNLQKAYMDTLSALTSAIDAKDSYTKGHSDRVTEISVTLGAALNLPQSEIEKLRLGGMLHDIGKIGIPELVLNKPGHLSDDEYNIMKSHPTQGVAILENVQFLENVIPIVRSHHERYDGRGYPDSLKGDEIPFLARIVSIADTYDAMTTDRPYRKALSAQEAVKEIKRCAGTQFDPHIAKTFIELVEKTKI
ncbi:MAG: HD domain-containing protein [Candidatus Riflebacteria bacterium]|mgnify:CR=1 FL=1|nr:HD domain-containing protein [Candidatus Riflebacteria bacterium]